MATSGCYPIKFIDACAGGFIFSVDKTGLLEDKYTQSKCVIHRLHSNTDKILLLNGEGEFRAQMLSKQEQEQPECKFNIQLYDNEKGEETPVMIYVNKDGKKLVVFCSGGDEVHPKEMDIPRQIDESSHKALFYLQTLKGSTKFMFESLAYRTKYLSFETVKDNVTLDKLVLRKRGADQPDRRCEMIPKSP